MCKLLAYEMLENTFYWQHLQQARLRDAFYPSSEHSIDVKLPHTFNSLHLNVVSSINTRLLGETSKRKNGRESF